MTPTPLNAKSTIAEIRARFDADVERFANLESGQAAVVDAPLMMELITRAAVATTPRIERVLDIGCGAGNNSLLLRQFTGHDFDVQLVDLSEPMLRRAQERLAAVNHGQITATAGDFRTVALPDAAFDVVLAAAVLHHLRDDDDWQSAFARLHRVVAPGGSVWITDLVAHETPAVQSLFWERYGKYLTESGGADYRDRVFAYIDREDSPRPVTYQLELLRAAGFSRVELLHKHGCFAAFGAVKSRSGC